MSTATLMSTQNADAVAITGGTMAGVVITSAGTVRATMAQTANANATYASITGLTLTVVPGNYKFQAMLPSTVAAGAGGIKYSFLYTGTVLSSMQATGRGYTASAVAVQNTTSTTGSADIFTQAAVVIFTELTGSFVVTTGGTITVQMAQNTSDASNSVALVGGTFQVTKTSN